MLVHFSCVPATNKWNLKVKNRKQKQKAILMIKLSISTHYADIKLTIHSDLYEAYFKTLIREMKE